MYNWNGNAGKCSRTVSDSFLLHVCCGFLSVTTTNRFHSGSLFGRSVLCQKGFCQSMDRNYAKPQHLNEHFAPGPTWPSMSAGWKYVIFFFSFFSCSFFFFLWVKIYWIEQKLGLTGCDLYSLIRAGFADGRPSAVLLLFKTITFIQNVKSFLFSIFLFSDRVFGPCCCDVMIYVSLVSISRLHHNNVTSCLPVSKLHKTVISPGVMLQIYRTLIRHNLQDFSR